MQRRNSLSIQKAAKILRVSDCLGLEAQRHMNAGILLLKRILGAALLTSIEVEVFRQPSSEFLRG